MGRKILTDAGYEVMTVNNGSAALKKIAEKKPDLIVLDVYMPGYSGLEVCQRLKESRETQRIPVLLTVGKLEPFKPEEARRARADAYIVKPFEASELLVALTKLEDKIVPQAEPYKPGRFAKAIAAVEEITQSEPSFGDTDSGWKNRISFPSAPAKTAEPEPAPEEIPPAGRRGFRDFFRLEPKRSAQQPENRDGIPKDITPEEIAAITAAAARIEKADGTAPAGEENKEPAAEVQSRDKAAVQGAELKQGETAVPGPSHQAATSPSAAEDAAAVTFATPVETRPLAADSSSASAHAPAASSAAHPEAESVEETKVTSAPSEASGDENVAEPAESVPSAARAPADAEVLAALQTLAPVSSSAATLASHSGPRWVAEAVALSSDEASLVLETEMQKAFAAFAAASESGFATFATASSGDPGDNGQPATTAVAVLPEEASNSAPVSASISEASEPRPEGVPIPAQQAEAPASLEAPSAVEPDAPVGKSEESSLSPGSTESTSAATSFTETIDRDSTASRDGSPASLPNSQESPVTPVIENKAAAPESAPPGASESDIPVTVPSIATTADASSTTSEPTAAEPAASSQPADGSAELDRKDEAEEDAAHAAAWANWHQIRQTVTASTSQLADEATAALKEIAADHGSEPEARAAAAGANAAASNPDAIASIVDSVLAELKPKLVQEIAKKLKKE
jgi:CheY-like chemotaxis protein